VRYEELFKEDQDMVDWVKANFPHVVFEYYTESPEGFWFNVRGRSVPLNRDLIEDATDGDARLGEMRAKLRF
jgi:hypothetical protein